MKQPTHPPTPSILASNKTVLKKNASIKRQLDEQIGSIYSYVKSHNHEFNSRTPTLDSNLLYPYIKKIYRDYDITDPLATKSRYKTPSAKKAIQLKQTFMTQLQKNQTILKQVPESKIKQAYRYCFICQSPILEANISYHQQEECPELKTFYELSFSQLEGFLQKKIFKLFDQVEELKGKLQRKNKSSQINEGILSVTDYLNVVGETLREKNDSRLQRYEIKKKYKDVMNHYDNDYIKLSQAVKKLQWFLKMHQNFCFQVENFKEQRRTNDV